MNKQSVNTENCIQNFMQEKYSCFLENMGYFGNYPSQSDINTMEKIGIHYFINLTCEQDRLEKYNVSSKSFQVNLPIFDRNVPNDIFNFTLLILKSVELLHQGQKIYIHCKGGHGRSGILVACILKMYLNVTTDKAIELTTKYHNERNGVREKWKRMGSPQTYKQKKFVHKMFSPFLFFKAYKSGNTIGLSNFSYHKIQSDLGTFNSSEAMFQSYKNISNKEYVEKLQKTVNPQIARNIGKREEVDYEWETKQFDIMVDILYQKCVQNKGVLATVLKSGLRPFIQHTKTDRYWGDGGDGSGHNYLGKAWCEVRKKIFNQFLKNESLDSKIMKYVIM